MRENHRLIAEIVAPLVLLLLVIAAFLLGYRTGSGGAWPWSRDSPATTTLVAGKGSPDAPVMIIEWADFQCPFCGRFYRQSLPRLEEEYLSTGEARLVYKDFPLRFHQYAQKAAEAGKCALEQGRFWEFHDKVFENQRNITIENLKRWAVEGGLDEERFNECLDSGRMAAVVQDEMAEGQAAGVRGTPTFLINGELVVGAQPYEEFKKVIEEKLSARVKAGSNS